MQTLLNKLLASAITAAPVIGYWLLATALVNLVARKSQINAWCEANPKRAGVMKFIRGTGCDPWLQIQGLSLLVVGKLPASLRGLIPVLCVLPLLVGCAGTFESARLAQPAAVKLSPVRLFANRCETLSDREYWFGITSIATGSTGAGAVLAVLPTPDKYETTLLIAGASAAAVSVVSGLASSKAGASYVAEGCAK